MARFRITFEATPEVGTAPWSGRESSRLKMMQSLTDYLLQRCACTNVSIMEVIDTPAVAVEEKEAAPKAATGKKRF